MVPDVMYFLPDDAEITAEEPCPDDDIPEAEKERLFWELCAMIDSGAIEPANEAI